MRPGTLELLECLKKQRSLKVSKKHFDDLLRDAAELGGDDFIAAAMDQLKPKSPAKKPSKKNAKPADPLVDLLKDYQRRTGLKVNEFVGALVEELRGNLPGQMPKSNVKSLAKFLAYARRHTNDQQIQEACKSVLEEFV